MGQRVYNFDAEMVLKDAGLVAASAAAQVDSADKILDVGAARMDGVIVVDVDAIEIASNDEEYDILLQGSNSSSFASAIENLAQLNLGATEVRQGGAQDSVVGRYEMPFTNEQASTVYRYLRLYTVVAGNIATGLNYRAYVAPKQGD
ncbi:MAG: hypothetical protein IT562_10845 [Alphaproteobacteria bacterium]|nr:hypothetical protein [Alphaproteobacteria bacterium]